MRLIAYPNRETWLEARRMAVCSSDAAGIMGESSWSSAVQLNYQKRGLIPAQSPDDARQEEFDWHREREREIANWWWKRQLPFIHPPLIPDGAILWDPGDYAIGYRVIDGVPCAATFDRLVLRAERTDLVQLTGQVYEIDIPERDILANGELKNANAYMAKHWQEEPPLVYLLQTQHQIMVAGTKRAFLVASIGGQPPVWAYLLPDGEISSALRSKYAPFWDRVLANEDDHADHRAVTAKAILERFPVDSGETVALGRDILKAWKNRKAASMSAKDFAKDRDEKTNIIKQAMGEATFAKLPDGTVLSLKANKKGSRVLRALNDDDNGEEEMGW